MNSFTKNLMSFVKTIIDYSVSIICLTALIPLITVLILAIGLTSKGPVIFSQIRIGRSGKPFVLYKFRSMHVGNDPGIQLITDRNDKRITSVGRFMRKHKFDEIPNFINVLKGEMSLVGPRPEQQYYIEQILHSTPGFKLLQDVKPGITSWGQVKYGYASNLEQMAERLNYDLYYMKNRSLWFDMKIILHTIWIIIKGNGI